MPCRNESAYVEKAVRDALAQERRGFALEVLVAVGPSHDDTHAIVERLATEHSEVRLIENPAGVVPHGLNAAIRAARGSYIVRMDAHSRYPADYVATLTAALDRLHADNVGGVWETLPVNGTDKAWAIAKVLSSGLGVGNAMFRLGVEGEREVDTVPYGCFRRELFDRIGYFDEELVRNQDDEHNGRIIRAGGRIVLLPQVRIQYFSRDRISKLWRMYREYGLFKPLVNIKLGAPATARQFAPPLFVLALFGLPLLALVFGPAIWLWAALVALYAITVVAVSLRIAARGGRWGAFPWLVAGFVAVHVGYGVGYLQGIVRFMVLRKRMRPEDVRTNR
jgi:glycosyltransferase involved in cell wall biosynthesis